MQKASHDGCNFATVREMWWIKLEFAGRV